MEPLNRESYIVVSHILVVVCDELITGSIIPNKITSDNIYAHRCHKPHVLYKYTYGDMDLDNVPLETHIWIL